MEQNKPFWNWMMNLGIVKWFIGLSVSKSVMKTKFGQKLFNYEMVTYILYGFLTTALNFVILFIFVDILKDKIIVGKQDFGVLIANIIAWVVAMLFAFVTNKIIVFKSTDMSARLVFKELYLFAAARLASLGFEEAWLYITVNLAGMNLIASKIVSGIIVIIMNYFFSKMFIFKNKAKQ